MLRQHCAFEFASNFRVKRILCTCLFMINLWSRLSLPKSLTFAGYRRVFTAKTSAMATEAASHATVNEKKTACKIGPSILNANLAKLGDECDKLLNAGADYLHLDVMDGHFVNNLTFGHPMVAALRPRFSSAFFDTHMMVAEPEKWISPMADAGASQYTFHFEASRDVPKTIHKIREAGMKVGLAIKPKTSVEVVFDFVELVDMVLIMTVEPGFGGQEFMHDMMPKVKRLRERFQQLDIEVDGGVTASTIQQAACNGANMFVAGSAIIKSSDWTKTISDMREKAEKEMRVWQQSSAS